MRVQIVLRKVEVNLVNCFYSIIGDTAQSRLRKIAHASFSFSSFSPCFFSQLRTIFSRGVGCINYNEIIIHFIVGNNTRRGGFFDFSSCVSRRSKRSASVGDANEGNTRD